MLIAGYGRVGRAIARVLAAHDIPFVALDLEPQRVAQAHREGLPVYYGDASQFGVLHAAGIGRARAAVITLNRPEAAERAVEAVRHHAAGLPIVARAHDLERGEILKSVGASAVVPETMETSLQMAGLLLRRAGLPDEAIDRSLKEFREGNYGGLVEEETSKDTAA